MTEDIEKKITKIRHQIHQHPEVSFGEEHTTERIREELQKTEGIELLDLPVKTGVVAILKGTGTSKGKCSEIALRADIDAIPQTENVDVPWKSENPGVMHACGHDLHTAALLGAAMALSRERDSFTGQVDFIFQPAEEVTRGAEALIHAGLFDVIHPERVFGLHNWPTVPAGKIVADPGPRMAAKINFVINVHGRGGHGSEPEHNIDPIVCAAAMIQSLQTVVSRNVSPLQNVILSVNSINGGSRENLVVDDVEMTATIRAIQQEAMDRAWERAQSIIESTAKAYACTASITIEDQIPAVENPQEMAEEARAIAVRAAGEESLFTAPPALASEDFSFYMQRVPSWFFWVGSGREDGKSAPLHSPDFNPDERALPVAAGLLETAALTEL